MITIFNSDSVQTATWKIGQDSPFYKVSQVADPELVQTIMVDGDELSLIHNKFEGLIHHQTEEPQIWTGDLAAYVLANLLFPKLTPVGLHAFSHEGVPKFEWSKGEKRDSTDLSEILDVEIVISNFTEISWLLSSYKHIPYHKDNSSQVWVGDIARFIAAHLPARDGQQ